MKHYVRIYIQFIHYIYPKKWGIIHMYMIYIYYISTARDISKTSAPLEGVKHRIISFMKTLTH